MKNKLLACAEILDIGIKAYLVSIIPLVMGIGGARLLKLDYRMLPGGVLVALTEIAGSAVMLWVLRRHSEAKALASVRSSVAALPTACLMPSVRR